MASVAKREWTHKGEVKVAWVVRYTDQEGKRRLKTFDKKKDADRHRTQVENEIESGTHVADAETTTFKEVCKLWLIDMERRGKSTGTPGLAYQEQARWVVRLHLVPAFGHKLITKITGEELQDFLDQQAARKGYHSLHAYRKFLKLIFLYAVRSKLLKRNVLSDYKVSNPVRPSRVAVPSLRNIQTILSTLDKRAHYGHEVTLLQRRCFVSLAIFGGLRLGEIAGLQWECIDFVEAVIHIKYSYSIALTGLKAPKTEAGIRVIAMVPPIRRALTDLCEHLRHPSTGFCFLTKDGKPYNTGAFHAGIWKPLLDEAGLLTPVDGKRYGRTPFRFHALRHANVSLLIAEGVPSINISRHIGHCSVSTTLDIYGHLFPEDQRVATTLGRLCKLT